MPVKTAQKFTDREVVAALNGCVDLDKYKELPTQVKKRIEELVNTRRTGISCTFERFGFALRVFDDKLPDRTRGSGGSDVLNEDEAQKVGRVATVATWVRCPKELFKVEILFLVMSDDGRKFVGEKYRPADPTKVAALSDAKTKKAVIREDENESDDEDEPEVIDWTVTDYDWKTTRTYAKAFKEDEARQVALACGGLIVKE